MAAFKKLSEFVEGRFALLTVRATEAFLEKSLKNPPTLSVELDDNCEILTSSTERRAHFAAVSPEWFKAQLKDWRNLDETVGSVRVRIATPEHPLEVICGNSCLILVSENRRYVLSTYRDIYPKGWIIPGGCPKNIKELLDPPLVAKRELEEEVLMVDTDGRIYYFFSPEAAVLAAHRWNLKPQDVVSLPYKEIYPGDAQRLVLKTKKREFVSSVILDIDPDIACLEIFRFFKVDLPIKLSKLQIFDGEFNEKDNSLLNRSIRLTERKKVVAIFSRGQNILSSDWITPTMKAAIRRGAKD